MTDPERRLVLRGMSIARGLLFNTSCTHHAVIKAYQCMLADVWSIDEADAIHRDEFETRRRAQRRDSNQIPRRG